MEYLVIGLDGQEYGPANLDTIRQWVADNRVTRETNLKDFQTGRVFQAGSMVELFPSGTQTLVPPVTVNYQNPPTAYPRPQKTQSKYFGADGTSDIMWAFFRCGLALVFFFVFRYMGLITAIYSLVYAFRAHQKGHQLGLVAMGISLVTLIFIGVGTFAPATFGLPPMQHQG